MKTMLETNGQVKLPRRIRTLRKLKPGERFEVSLDEDDPDLILLRRQRASVNEGLVDHLLSCPVKDFLAQPARRVQPMRRVRL